MSLNDFIAFHAVIHAAHKTALYNGGSNPRDADVSCDIPFVIFLSMEKSKNVSKLLKANLTPETLFMYCGDTNEHRCDRIQAA